MRILVVGLAVLWLGLIAASWAEADTTTDRAPASTTPNGVTSGSGDEDYNFSWLDPEKKIYVLQNRKYAKAEKVLISAMAGPGLSNPFRTVLNLDLRLAYYFSESWGIEGFYVNVINSPNNTFKALNGTGSGVYPVTREFNSELGALVHWVPWYAKINVFNSILYFDWYFAAGIGNLSSNVFPFSLSGGTPTAVSQNNTALILGTGHQYHLSQNFIVRLDFTEAIYRAFVFGVNDGTPGKDEQATYSNFNFSVGLGLKL